MSGSVRMGNTIPMENMFMGDVIFTVKPSLPMGFTAGSVSGSSGECRKVRKILISFSPLLCRNNHTLYCRKTASLKHVLRQPARLPLRFTVPGPSLFWSWPWSCQQRPSPLYPSPGHSAHPWWKLDAGLPWPAVLWSCRTRPSPSDLCSGPESSHPARCFSLYHPGPIE